MKPSKIKIVSIGLLLCFAGCERAQEAIPYRQFLSHLTNLDYIARIDVPETALLASFDPTGGNNDFNHPLREEKDGWVVLADLKGPGYVSRFWFTGAEAKHRVRFFFDNEKNPRLDLTIGEFCGGLAPFRPPLAAYENYCWYNYLPLPYAKRLLILTQKGGYQPDGGPKLYHQINYTALPRSRRLDSFSLPLTPDDEKCLAEIAQRWNNPAGISRDYEPFITTNIQVAARGNESIQVVNGPAVIRELIMIPDFSNLNSPARRQGVFRDVILKINWDNQAEPSVAVPFGSFFGSVWYKTSGRSLFFGMTNDSFYCRFPMPYRRRAVLTLENQTTNAVNFALLVKGEKFIALPEQYGFFHAAGRISTPAEIGAPHCVLATNGKGRFAGCILSALSLDNSFWLLEGDEIMFRDNAQKPFWHGTGLEDYFNGGWYYQNVVCRPLHGLLFKSFFRAVQYRLHLPDPVLFKKSFNMIFERGPENKSRGWIESTAFYYLAQPQAVASAMLDPGHRQPPVDNPQLAGMMLDIFNYERFGDYSGASEYIAAFLEQYPATPFVDAFRLRQAAYLEKISGFAKARPVYERIMAETKDESVRSQAQMLLWLHAQPANAILGVYANAPTRCFLDGQLVAESANPARLKAVGVNLKPGKHVLALQCAYRPYPAWVQACLQTGSETIITDPSWKNCINPPGDWKQVDYDDSAWQTIGGTGCKGPPEEPFVWIEPNAFIDMQARAAAIFCSLPWPDKTRPIVFRKVFEIYPPK